MRPEHTTDKGVEVVWTPEILALWDKRVAPRFKEGERCSTANYFTPRPYVDQYNRGSNRAGFTYVVQPGNHVCQETWIPVD
jgi:hypothetical protein